MDILAQAKPLIDARSQAAPGREPLAGTIALTVDATDIERRIIRVQETIPVAAAGRMTLLYPEWLPGDHAPQAPIELLAGIVRYDFLLALSDELGSIAVKDHRSCETGTDPTFFTQSDSSFSKRDVVAHEYVHAWNGKFRRGNDSWTPSFDRPIGTSLRWVYAGQTQYWGHVLSARAGLWTVQQGLEALAYTAVTYDLRAGRS